MLSRETHAERGYRLAPRTQVHPLPSVSRTRFLPLIRAIFALAFGSALAACSLLVNKSTAQCSSDSDCHSSTYSLCQDSVCVDPRTVGAAGSTGCMGPNGCVPCAADAGVDFLNACTNSMCVPFDNATRLKNLSADGGRKPLP